MPHQSCWNIFKIQPSNDSHHRFVILATRLFDKATFNWPSRFGPAKNTIPSVVLKDMTQQNVPIHKDICPLKRASVLSKGVFKWSVTQWESLRRPHHWRSSDITVPRLCKWPWSNTHDGSTAQIGDRRGGQKVLLQYIDTTQRIDSVIVSRTPFRT